MSTLFLNTLNKSVTTGWLILAVIVLRPLMTKVPKWISCALWALVAVRLLCPVSIESTLSLIPNENPVQEQTIFYSHTPVAKNGVTMQNDSADSVPEHPLETALPDADGNSWNLLLYLGSLVWIAGILLMLVYGVFGYVRLSRQTEISMRLRDNVFLCDAISTSFILGIIRPRIFLPSGMDETQKAHMLAHENAHIRRHDHWWKPFGFLILTCYWFSPLCWAAYILFCRDMEFACDEKVIRDFTFHDRKEYSKTLLACSTQPKTFTAYPLAFGEVGVKKRISAVLNYKRPAFWAVLLAAAVCIATAVGFLTSPPKDKPVSRKEAPSSSGITLELIDMKADCPYYELVFQKTDQTTGEVIPFETNFKDEGPAASISLKTPMNSSYQYLDPEEDTFRSLLYSFYDLDGADSVTVTVDGISCTVKLPQEKYREISLHQEIDVPLDFSQAKSIDSARIYPNALVLYCKSGAPSTENNKKYGIELFTKDSAQNTVLPKLSHGSAAFIADDPHMSRHLAFVFCFADASPEDQPLYFCTVESGYEGEKILKEYELKLTE